MLWQWGIDSGLAQIFPCENCGPIHAFVEAEYEGGRMVVDPLWDIDYPTADGRFLGTQELAGTSLGRQRLAELQRQRGMGDKIQYMSPAEATFDFARAVNWQKNAFHSRGRLLAYGCWDTLPSTYSDRIFWKIRNLRSLYFCLRLQELSCF